MSNIAMLSAGGVVSRQQKEALFEMDRKIAEAIDEAKKAGVPQGFIVSTLAGHAHVQTHRMVTNA
ncbi:hypothetical protein [Pseudomonas aeruginosa]|uniref:hypothetical protein n=1 Tax=Pseudomonas aeruginosa TaxID=287 RepID=UPI0003B97C91|nr:hypothetical protein [Pseudomonas aeruginosa]HCL2813500.1 hypothetical protein [Pseudomonas aeruginosa 7D9A]ASA30056.1 hypothetical protein CDG41_18310 [Pseudomonas aeruginosa]ASD04201.1 hypothetical protein CD797_17545 [Pseudomonas aeruginosa]EIU1442305.1 hypothetical protein [Pseudomonas aeruginosa]EIU2824126.1 hypothetical protein [Pseudomonas aeruginosa]